MIAAVRLRAEARRVLKFGGSSLATPEKIQSVATRIAAMVRGGRQLVVVVSAMGETTNDLLALAQRVSPHPNRRELDMLLTTGERISMSLLSMALHDRGCPSISFTGSQAGVLTDGSFSNADIVNIRPIRVARELRRHRVVVLAGFQGVDPKTKEITTLGRGGSDTTAIAMASVLHARGCEIYKDVDGVLGADPKIIPNAPMYKTIPLNLLHEFCNWGAKILNVRSVEWAIRGQVPIAIGRSSDFALGTKIVNVLTRPNQKSRPSKSKIIGLHSHSHVIELIVKNRAKAAAAKTIAEILNAQSLPMPKILTVQELKFGVRLFVTLDADTLAQIEHALKISKRVELQREDLSSVALTQSHNNRGNKSESFASDRSIFHFTTPWSEVSVLPRSARIEFMKSIGETVFPNQRPPIGV